MAAKRAGRLEEAEAKLREGIELDADNVRAHWVLAWTLVALEREPEAVQEFQQVIDLTADPQLRQEAADAIARLQDQLR